MRVAMFAPSATFPVGGTNAIFEFADGLARRGHDVTLAHTTFAFGLTPVEEIWWHQFEPSVTHLYDEDPPPGDVAISYFGDIRPDLGRPFMWVQARYTVPNEDTILLAECPKLCISTWLQDIVRTEGVGHAHHVPYGLRHDKWRSTREWAERDPVVAMLYSAHPVKGGGLGVTVLRQVMARRPDVRCVAFGTHPVEGQLAPGIEYLLNPAQDRLVELMGSARVYLQPSMFEGFGMTAIEAMGCGATLVTTDCGGSRDYANDDTAYVVPRNEPAPLADAVIHALDDGSARAAAGQRHVKRYDWDRSAEILEAVLLS